MITQLASPCWVPSWDGDTRDDQTASYGGHYAEPGKITGFEGFTDAQNACFHKGCDGIVVFGLGGGYCTSCETENLGDEEWEIREIAPRQLSQACWEGARTTQPAPLPRDPADRCGMPRAAGEIPGPFVTKKTDTPEDRFVRGSR